MQYSTTKVFLKIVKSKIRFMQVLTLTWNCKNAFHHKTRLVVRFAMENQLFASTNADLSFFCSWATGAKTKGNQRLWIKVFNPSKKIEKSARKKKWAWKNNAGVKRKKMPEKKSPKWPKRVSRALFIFKGKKKIKHRANPSQNTSFLVFYSQKPILSNCQLWL